jgi:Bacterial SH3 domain
MAHPKLNPPDSALPFRVSRPGAETISLTARRLARPKSQAKPHISGADQAALSRIAERFAPGVPGGPGVTGAQSDAAPEAATKSASKDTPKDESFDRQVPQSPILASLSEVRTLIAVLIAVALLPSLSLGAMLWLGEIKTPWSTGAHAEGAPLPSSKASLAATTPSPGRAQSTQAAAVGALALTAPDALDAEAGGEMPFAVALDHAGSLPARSVIAVAGLPHGATLSAGRPYGEAEWNLRTDEIGDLRITLPKAASGESRLRVKLVAPDGEILAGTETVLKVSAASDPGIGEADGRALTPDRIYDPNLVGVAAWDGKTQQLLGASGVEEVFTTQEAPPAPPEHIQPSLAAKDDAKAWVAPEFVNLRNGPTSSAEVISVVAKGAKLSIMGRKRGWVKVTDPATSESGWVYAGSKARRSKQTDQSDAGGSIWPSWLGGG